MLNVAIDGPAGAGKSTIAQAVARALGCIYVDTGAMYRAVGLYALENGVTLAQMEAEPDKLLPLLPQIRLELFYEDGGQRIRLNGRDVSQEIRTPDMGMAASRVSAIPAVRAHLLDLQRDMAKTHDVVMDGRDIGTVILPDANVKIFLTASAEERARRRHAEYVAKGENISYNKVLQDIKERDYADVTKAVSPLVQAPDAVLVDTTTFTLEEAIATIRDIITARGAQAT